MPLAVAFRSLLGACVSESLVDHCIGTYQRKFNEIVLPSAKSLVYPGVAEGLDQLRADGVVLAVATSKFHANADSLLAAAGLRSAFSLVVGADEVDRPKPNPDMGEYVLGKLGVPATRAVMIGDTTHDVLMARAVGMRSIAVTYGVHGRRELLASKPTWVADDFSAVTRLLSAATEAA
jgi:phosphoglycolate phosphatase